MIPFCLYQDLLLSVPNIKTLSYVNLFLSITREGERERVREWERKREREKERIGREKEGKKRRDGEGEFNFFFSFVLRKSDMRHLN